MKVTKTGRKEAQVKQQDKTKRMEKRSLGCSMSLFRWKHTTDAHIADKHGQGNAMTTRQDNN